MKTDIKKSVISSALLLAMGLTAPTTQAVVLGNNDGNFTMLSNGGGLIGGANDIFATWDGTFNTSVDTAVVNMTISSQTNFFSKPWTAHSVKVFGPGTYTFEACPDDGSLSCTLNSTPISMTVGEGQIGAHMLFDWNGNVNIDVVNVWDVNSLWQGAPNNPNAARSPLYIRNLPACENYVGRPKQNHNVAQECLDLLSTNWYLSSTDDDGDMVPGTPMVDGAFSGSSANFNLRAPVPVPAAVWLFGSGLLGLIGIARRKHS